MTFTGATPYSLVYEMKLVLPIKLDDDAGFWESKRVVLLECGRVMVVILRPRICMWFGPVNKETYVHGCDRARSLCIGNNSGDRDDPTGLELSPVGRRGLYGPSVFVPCSSEREIAREREWIPFSGVGRPLL